MPDELGGRIRNHAVWIGPLVALVGTVSYVTFFVRFPGLRDFPWVNLPLVLAGLGWSAVGAWRGVARADRYRGKVSGLIGLASSLAVSALFIAYVFWISYWLPPPTRASLDIGHSGDFRLIDQDGDAFRLADLRGRKVALVFFRGHW